MTIDPLHPPVERRSRVTIAEWLALPAEQRAELIDGRIVTYAMPGPLHGAAQAGIAAAVRGAFHRAKGDAPRPGGWWISQEVDMELGELGCRPDLVGWERERHPLLPRPDARGVVTAVPGWICEVLSPSTATYDMGPKRRGYHRAGVEWYWLVDPTNRTLTVLRRTEPDYLVVLVAGVGEMVRADPFAAVEIDVAEVFDFGDASPLG